MQATAPSVPVQSPARARQRQAGQRSGGRGRCGLLTRKLWQWETDRTLLHTALYSRSSAHTFKLLYHTKCQHTLLAQKREDMESKSLKLLPQLVCIWPLWLQRQENQNWKTETQAELTPGFRVSTCLVLATHKPFNGFSTAILRVSFLSYIKMSASNSEER